MTYFKDLSPYAYMEDHGTLNLPTLNIGWLSNREPFQKGRSARGFKDKLLRFCSDEFVVLIARGFHTCEFCGLKEQWYKERQGKYGEKASWASIGDGEIRVLGKSAVYAAPTLIYHYVLEHQYKPPREFIEAILAGEPDSKEQQELLSHYYRA